MTRKQIIISDYLSYRARIRTFDLDVIEQIARYSEERYFDTVTQRMIVIGKHADQLVMIPYEETDETITPVTIHAITRQQIRFRLQTGRLTL